MLVPLPQKAQQLDDLQEMWNAGGQRLLLVAGTADVLLVRMVLWTPTGAGTGAKHAGQEWQTKKEARVDVQCSENGGTHAMCSDGPGPWDGDA